MDWYASHAVQQCGQDTANSVFILIQVHDAKMVDAAVVMVENAHRKLEAWQAANPGREIEGDVVVVGAGISGLAIADQLTMAGAGVVVLRYTQPETPRPFRVPFATFTGVAGVIVCFAMAYALPHDTWIRLAIWTGIGFAIYFAYGYRRSRMAQAAVQDAESEPSMSRPSR